MSFRPLPISAYPWLHPEFTDTKAFRWTFLCKSPCTRTYNAFGVKSPGTQSVKHRKTQTPPSLRAPRRRAVTACLAKWQGLAEDVSPPATERSESRLEVGWGGACGSRNQPLLGSCFPLEWILAAALGFTLTTFPSYIRRRQWQPTPALLPGESRGRGSPGGCRLRGLTESDTTGPT